jgi:hypothetical protein
MDYYFSTAVCLGVKGGVMDAKSFKISNNKRLVLTWLSLLIMSLMSALLAETSSINTVSGVFVCFVIAMKAQLVIDHLVGLRWAHKRIRRVMLGYFYILPLLISTGIIFPEFIVSITTLGS